MVCLVSGLFHLLAAFFKAFVDSLALGVDDILQALFEVVHKGVHVVTLKLLLALLAKSLHHVAQAVDALTAIIVHAALKHVAKGAINVAVRQDVFGQRLQNSVLVHVRPVLSAVPARVLVSSHSYLPKLGFGVQGLGVGSQGH